MPTVFVFFSVYIRYLLYTNIFIFSKLLIALFSDKKKIVVFS
jgi:hypothetical protein